MKTMELHKTWNIWKFYEEYKKNCVKHKNKIILSLKILRNVTNPATYFVKDKNFELVATFHNI
jgi:hypothetical protein